MRRWWGVILIAVGVALLLLAGAYYGYFAYSKAEYDRLTSNQPPPNLTSATATPGEEPTSTPQRSLPPERIVIQAIGLDSPVVGVVWEVPKGVVGHWIQSANPGENGNIVVWGHLRSDLLGAGNVFEQLPEIGKYVGATQSTDGETKLYPPETPREVLITLYNSAGAYTYRVMDFGTTVIKPDDPSASWVMSPTQDQTLTLLTCVPKFAYTHRYVVIAKPYLGEVEITPLPGPETNWWLVGGLVLLALLAVLTTFLLLWRRMRRHPGVPHSAPPNPR